MINLTNNNYISFNAKIKFKDNVSNQPAKNFGTKSLYTAKLAGQNFMINSMGLAKLLIGIKPVINRLCKIHKSVKMPS